MTEERIKELESNSSMLSQIAGLVSDYCVNEESTTLVAVKLLIADKESEEKWANHYHTKLRKLQTMGRIPEWFEW